jgi:hypothetical protein
MAFVDVFIASRVCGSQQSSDHFTFCFGYQATLWFIVSIVARCFIRQILAHARILMHQARSRKFIVAIDDAHSVAVS